MYENYRLIYEKALFRVHGLHHSDLQQVYIHAFWVHIGDIVYERGFIYEKYRLIYKKALFS